MQKFQGKTTDVDCVGADPAKSNGYQNKKRVRNPAH